MRSLILKSIPVGKITNLKRGFHRNNSVNSGDNWRRNLDCRFRDVLAAVGAGCRVKMLALAVKPW